MVLSYCYKEQYKENFVSKIRPFRNPWLIYVLWNGYVLCVSIYQEWIL